jgi:hypothetical protein
MVDISSYVVRHDIDLAMLMTAEALTARGWVPAPRVAERLGELAAQRRV